MNYSSCIGKRNETIGATEIGNRLHHTSCNNHQQLQSPSPAHDDWLLALFCRQDSIVQL